MSFSWGSSNRQKKSLKNQLERQNLDFLWCYLLHGHSEESQNSQREDHWGMATSIHPQRIELPLQDICTLAGVCRKDSVWQKCKCLSSTAWHSVGRELWAQRAFLFYICMQSGWASGSSSWWLTLLGLPGSSVCSVLAGSSFMSLDSPKFPSLGQEES